MVFKFNSVDLKIKNFCDYANEKSDDAIMHLRLYSQNFDCNSLKRTKEFYYFYGIAEAFKYGKIVAGWADTSLREKASWLAKMAKKHYAKKDVEHLLSFNYSWTSGDFGSYIPCPPLTEEELYYFDKGIKTGLEAVFVKYYQIFHPNECCPWVETLGNQGDV